MLNLVELGSNYLPLIHVVPKMRFVFILGEIIGFWWKRGLQMRFQGRLEVRGSPGIKYSKVEENSARHGRATGVHGRVPKAEQAKPARWTHYQPFLDARPPVRWCTGDREPVHKQPCVKARPCRRPVPRSFAFFGLYILFSFIFLGDS